MSDRKTVHLHVGCPKTGTSYLQFALRRSVDELEEQGVGFPLGAERLGHVSGLLRPFEPGVDPEVTREALEELTRLVDRAEQPRQLITLEDLASFEPHQCDAVVDALSAHDVHVIITARDWSKQLPSQWQQEVKQRDTATLPQFLEDVRRGEGPVFHSKQYLPGVARRWGHTLPPERVHIVAVPPSTAETGRVQDLFGSVVGFDPERLTLPRRGINESLGYAQAEALRQVNLALGDRLTERNDYRSAVYTYVMRQFLLRQPDKIKIALPGDYVQWCHEQSVLQVEELRAAGYDLVGDTVNLLAPEEPAASYREPEPTEVTQAVVNALADLAAGREEELAEIRRKAERRGVLKAQKAMREEATRKRAAEQQHGAAAAPTRSRARRLAGRVARRLRLR